MPASHTPTSAPTALQSTFKSNDTEERIDIYFTRPLGLLWARFFIALGFHPNIVTLLSIVLGACAGIAMSQGAGSLPHTLLGIGLLVWANIYDSTDGQMARMTGKKTLWGRILDGFAGDVWFTAIYAAIGYRLIAQPVLPFWDESPQWSVWIFPVLYVVGFHFHAVQSRLADYYRNIHLYFLKGESGSELDSSDKLREEYAALRWRDRWAWKLFLRFYCRYTAGQERDTPVFQQFKREVDGRFGRAIPPAFAQAFLCRSRRLMKWTNVLTFNWRAITLYAALLLAVEHPWCVVLYPLAEITLFQLIYLHMRRSHEALCASLLPSLRPAPRP